MVKHSGKGSVYMVANGNVINGIPEISTFVQSQASSMRMAGWEVFLGIVDDRTSIKGIIRNIRRLQGEVGQKKPDLVHVLYGSMTALVSYLGKRKLPLVLSFCGSDLLGVPAPSFAWRVREWVGRFIGLWVAGRSAAIIVKSNNLLQSLPKNLREKAAIIPNGVDVNFFRPIEKKEARAKLGWSQEARVVVFNPSKDHNQYVKNFNLARRTVEDLARYVPNTSLQLIANVSAEEVLLRLNAADCLLVTSLHEGSPNIVKEAMACNLPVISVPCGDVPERLVGAFPGGVYPYDALALSAGIQEVFKFKERSNGLEQLIAQGLTADLIAERLTQIYCKVQTENIFNK
ncbi:MAG: hypothetical protein NPIRA03_22730 [Nitrospirales bacterium]|nr:MAG: hypothetical protein NPIRA03_22730 [Nitrospirales bacterium]